MTHPRNILATYALIYANGHVHLGHLLGYIQTDIWTRFQKFRGHHCHFICGADTHGTPIMLNAEKMGLTPEAMIEKISKEQLADFNAFGIEFDAFDSTHSEMNKTVVYEIYQKLVAAGAIKKKTIEQAFDEEKQMFIPDRYLKGTCPCCGAEDQYGDGCEACGSTYETTALKNPVSVLSNKPPIYKESEHFFFHLDQFREPLRSWIQGGHLQTEVANKLNEWFKEGLHDWDISRDAPYFGFEIPGFKDKYFYVWLDAPVGYLSAFKTYCQKNNLNYNDFIKPDSATEMHHFVGKDIIYFHALFWPAMLMGADIRTPTQVHAHGYLTINGQKMSKSRGTFIRAKDYLVQGLNTEYLRYYFAAKLSSRIDDIDLNLEDFVARVNADMVGKLVNIASRTAGFIHKKFAGKLAESLLDQELFERFIEPKETIAHYYEEMEYSKLIREVMSLADSANQFIEKYQPWSLAKEEAQLPLVQQVCTQALNLFKVLIGYLKPVIPATASQAEKFLNCEIKHWDDITQPLLAHSINKFQPLMTRVETEKVEALSQ